MFLDQLILIIKSSLSNIKINKYKLRHELNSDPRVSLLKGGEYKFIDIADHIDKYQPLFDEIEDYILNKGQLVDVSDLHEHIDEFSESEKPSKSEELLMLLELDNRFTVLGDNLIGLL